MGEKPLKIANLPTQVLILMGKNFIMFRRNIIATIVEIICPILFLLILFIMRYFVEKIVYPEQFNQARSYLAFFYPPQNSQIRNQVLYYPNTDFIQDLINKTVQTLVDFNYEFTPTRNFSRLNLIHIKFLSKHSLFINLFSDWSKCNFR